MTHPFSPIILPSIHNFISPPPIPTMLLHIFISTLIPLLLSSTTKNYSIASGRMNFGQTVKTKSTTLPIIPNPIVLYSLSTARITGYFGYNSNHTLTPTSPTQSLLTLTAQISKVTYYQIILGYLVIESMPNIQDGIVKLTLDQNIVKFKSKKRIVRNNDLNVAAHLIGFSSSKIARDNFYYTAVFDYTYQIWTSAEMSPVDYMVIHFFILDANYEEGNTVCMGGFVYSQSRVHNTMSPLSVLIDPSLHILLGLEAINLPNADFSFNFETKQVIMPQTGAYSFSIIAINTTCETLLTSSTYSTGEYEKIYSTVFVVFLALTCITFIIAITVYIVGVVLRKRRGRLGKTSEISGEDGLRWNSDEIKVSVMNSGPGSQKDLVKSEKRLESEPESGESPETGVRMEPIRKPQKIIKGGKKKRQRNGE